MPSWQSAWTGHGVNLVPPWSIATQLQKPAYWFLWISDLGAGWVISARSTGGFCQAAFQFNPVLWPCLLHKTLPLPFHKPKINTRQFDYTWDLLKPLKIFIQACLQNMPNNAMMSHFWLYSHKKRNTRQTGLTRGVNLMRFCMSFKQCCDVTEFDCTHCSKTMQCLIKHCV